MTIRSSHARFVSLAWIFVVVAVAGLVATSPAHAQTTFSGDAFAAKVVLPPNAIFPNGQTILVSDTGALSPSGGERHNALFTTQELNNPTLDSVLTAEVLTASTSGASGKADSSASLANVVILPGNAAQVTASFVRADSQATCSGASGVSEIANLTFAGQSITVTGQPNQTVTIPGLATLIINEQMNSSSGTHKQIHVNALHLIVPGVADVTLAGAESDIDCTGAVSQGPCHDFVTGGGYIFVNEGSSRANFGFNAGFRAGATTPDGHLNYIDHNTGHHVKGTNVTTYLITGTGNSRHFEGDAEVDGAPGQHYSVDVTDGGTPGRQGDFFTISVRPSNVSGSGPLQGGNIVLHAPCQQ